MNDYLIKLVEEKTNLSTKQISAVLALLEEGATIPFIARYRKEATGGLDDELLRSLNERLVYLKKLDERRRQVLNNIEKQGKLTSALEEEINDATTIVELEDLYRPFKQKKQTLMHKFSNHIFFNAKYHKNNT